MDSPQYGVRSKLVQYGHHLCPENYQSGNILTEQAFRNSDINDPAVEAAVRSYQEWFAPTLDQLTLRTPEFGGHKRMSIADGHAGNNTIDLLSFSRCGCPDYYPEELREEQGNWPDQCRQEITTSYQMTLSGLSPSDVARLWQEADQNWQDVFDITFQFELENYPNTRIWTFRANLSGSVLADQYLANSDCGSRSQGRIDNRTWNDVLFVTTVTHEHGHALGCPHSQDSQATMYPSITDTSMSRRGRPHASDIEIMLDIGYELRTEPEENALLSGKMYVENEQKDVIGEFVIAQPVNLISPIGDVQGILGDVTLSDGDSEKKFRFAPKPRLL